MKSLSVVYGLVLSFLLSGCGLILDTAIESDLGCTSNAECDDGNACNGEEQCVDSACEAGEEPSCDDGLACTTDSCSAELGCEYVPNDAACDDDQLCVLGQGCVTATECTTDDECAGYDVGTCAVGVCGTTGLCTVVLQHELCEDSIACTTDVCGSDGECKNTAANTVCTDGVACTLDLCDPSSADRDANGCVFNARHTECNDSFDCTDDYCIPENDLVSIEGCFHVPHDEVCDSANSVDGGPVPESSCVESVCVPSLGCQRRVAIFCDTGSKCNLETGVCDRFSGCNEDDECDDGDPCNGTEECVGDGFCQEGVDEDEDGLLPCQLSETDSECTRSFCASTDESAYTCYEWPSLSCYEDTIGTLLSP